MGRFDGRPLERIWFLFFVMHIPITFFVDCSHLLPSALRPFPGFIPWYIRTSADPILGGAYYGGKEWDWIRLFLQVELWFQMPCYLIGAWGLWHNDWRVYPVIFAYAVQAQTTMVPVLHALYTDSTVPRPNTTQLLNNWAAYLIFAGIYLGIMLQAGGKMVRILGDTQRSQRKGKSKVA